MLGFKGPGKCFTQGTNRSNDHDKMGYANWRVGHVSASDYKLPAKGLLLQNRRIAVYSPGAAKELPGWIGKGIINCCSAIMLSMARRFKG